MFYNHWPSGNIFVWLSTGLAPNLNLLMLFISHLGPKIQ